MARGDDPLCRSLPGIINSLQEDKQNSQTELMYNRRQTYVHLLSIPCLSYVAISAQHLTRSRKVGGSGGTVWEGGREEG